MSRSTSWCAHGEARPACAPTFRPKLTFVGTFKESGFLSAANQPPQEILQVLRPWMDICLEGNSLAHRLLAEEGPLSSAFPYRAAAALFRRTLQSLQATYLLAIAGLRQDAAVALRTSFESFCALRAANEKPKLLKTLLDGDRRLFKARAGEAVDRLKKGTPRDLETIRKLEHVRALLEESGELSPKVHIEQLAREVGLFDAYQTLYRITSDYAHPSLTALREFARREGAGWVLTYQPEFGDAELHLVTVAQLLIDAQAEYVRLFGVLLPEGFLELRERFEELSDSRRG